MKHIALLLFVFALTWSGIAFGKRFNPKALTKRTRRQLPKAIKSANGPASAPQENPYLQAG